MDDHNCDDPPMIEQDEKGRFLPGNSGNGGRVKGARNKLGEAFVMDLYEHWKANGTTAIQACMVESPSAYCRVVASLLPKEVNLNVNPLDEVSDDDIAVGLAAIRAARAAGTPIPRPGAKAKGAQVSH